jgi:hypothetical protein
MYSKRHAEILFRQHKLSEDKWAIRGLHRLTLKALNEIVEHHSRYGFKIAISFWPPGADETYPGVNFPISSQQLALEYYDENTPKIDRNIPSETVSPKNRRDFLRENGVR